MPSVRTRFCDSPWDPDYYLRFGFRPAGEWGIKGFFRAPAEAFMAFELEKGALEGASGVVKFPDELNDLEEWSCIVPEIGMIWL